MLKTAYLDTIISNLGITISLENDIEIILKNDIFYDKKSDCFCLSDEYKSFYQQFGTLIVDFQNTDFYNQDSFITFFNKYCLFGLEKKQLNKLFHNHKCPTSKYEVFVKKTFCKYQKLLSSFQEEINSILSYCILAPKKSTLSLTPFERLCTLEYSQNSPGLIQENNILKIKLNTLSNISDINISKSDLVKKLNSNETKAYSNNFYVPMDIPSLLNFELGEVINNNIKMRICNYCGKYFLASNRNAIYCNNIAPGYTKKTCKQVASNNKYASSFKDDSALLLFNKVYHKKAYKASRYKDILEYQENFDLFKKEGRKKVKRYRENKMTKAEFMEWIKSNQ